MSFVYKGLEWVDLQKRNRKQMFNQLKKQPEDKFTALKKIS